MITLSFARSDPPVSHMLCLGAHADDLEIGCGGTMMKLIEEGRLPVVTWIVFGAEGERAREARQSANCLLAPVEKKEIVIHSFRDGFFPFLRAEIKEYFEQLKTIVSPDLIFTHYRDDGHQDHRLINELTWNTFRDHLILEYEIPKYDGDLGSPNIFVPLDGPICRRKIRHLMETFKTQHSKRWFTEDLFAALLRIRGMECNAQSTFAEAFYCRKLALA